MSTLGGGSLFAGINSGLTSTYALLANAYPGGVTASTIAQASTNPSLTNMLNPTFASYIQTNFSSLDTDKNGVLSSAELSAMTNRIASQGLTQAQLSQLGTASGMSAAALGQVLDHFNDIDTNHDGKITTAEISAFTIKSSEDKKKTEFANRAATSMSVFYGSEDSGTPDSSSILSYRNLNNDTDNSTVST